MAGQCLTRVHRTGQSDLTWEVRYRRRHMIGNGNPHTAAVALTPATEQGAEIALSVNPLQQTIDRAD